MFDVSRPCGDSAFVWAVLYSYPEMMLGIAGLFAAPRGRPLARLTFADAGASVFGVAIGAAVRWSSGRDGPRPSVELELDAQAGPGGQNELLKDALVAGVPRGEGGSLRLVGSHRERHVP